MEEESRILGVRIKKFAAHKDVLVAEQQNSNTQKNKRWKIWQPAVGRWWITRQKVEDH